MVEFASWVGKCQFQAVSSDDTEIHDFEAYVAVWTDSREAFEATINTHFQDNTHRLFWAEDVHPALSWLKKHGHNNTIIGLSKSVSEQNLVEMSKLSDIDENGQYLKDEGYLTIIEHDIPKLPEQEGVPFWEREWIVPELKEILFGQPESSEEIRTYFIVDATLRKNITGYFDLDSLDVPIQCLFKGDAAEEMKEVAPYLIDMTLPEGAWDNKDKVPDFHKNFFAKHWGENTGVFIRTTAPMNEVWRHFRKFTKVQVEEDKRWVFFRFWDPRIAHKYFPIHQFDKERTSLWFRNMYQIICEMNSGKMANTFYSNEKLLSVDKNSAHGPLQITKEELAPFVEKQAQEDIEKIIRLLKSSFAHELKNMSDHLLEADVETCINRMRGYGFSRFENLYILSAWAAFYGGKFEMKDKTGKLENICCSDIDENTKMHLLKEAMGNIKITEVA